ncbi:MAG: biopolymer transporter ExbD [Pseudomonadota bacterium]
MALRTRSEQEAMSEINVTPLVDVMLVLLVIFIVTAPLMTRAVHVELPETAATAPVEQAPHVHVSMDAQGAAFIDNRPLALEALEAELAARLAAQPGLTVQVHGDERTPYGSMALLMSVIQRAGATRVDLVTVPLPH